MNTEEIIICPEYSAIAAKDKSNPSRATQAAIEVLKEANVFKVAEIGCGLLANTPHILKNFPFVVLVDTKRQYTRIEHKIAELLKTHGSLKEFINSESFATTQMELDGAIVINILHILPTQNDRLGLLVATYKNLRGGGLIFIDVPYNETFYRGLVKTAQVYNDGYIMCRGSKYFTFYKNMTFSELKEYAEKAGFEFEKRVYLDHRVSIICRKNLDRE